jgi:hypothetical protein
MQAYGAYLSLASCCWRLHLLCFRFYHLSVPPTNGSKKQMAAIHVQSETACARLKEALFLGETAGKGQR